MFLERKHLNLDFLKFKCIFPIATAVFTFFSNVLLLFKGFKVFYWKKQNKTKQKQKNKKIKNKKIIKKNPTKLYPKILGNFSIGRNSDGNHGWNLMKSRFFCQIYAIFWEKKNGHVVIGRYFSLFLKGSQDFS